MLRKLKSTVVAALVGAGGGALLGGFAWLIERLGGPTSLAELGGTVLRGSIIGSLAGGLFALTLIGYGRVRKGSGLSKHSATAIGGVVGPLSFFAIAFANGTSLGDLSGETVIGVITVYGAMGALAGRVLASLVAGDQDGSAETALGELQTPNPLERFYAVRRQREKSPDAR